ncbi:hypothetical protein NF681_09155 [Comamonadaceae bacterium OTU4NAUVB1]|nr:hypothetical protein NF681_09155 [Comamonadaceae bacterium OTU4NAUVB1]
MRIVRFLANAALGIALLLFIIGLPKAAAFVFGLTNVVHLLHAMSTGKQKNEGMH